MRRLALAIALFALTGCQRTVNLYDMDAGHGAGGGQTATGGQSATGGQTGKGGGGPTDGGFPDGHCGGGSTPLTFTPDSARMAIVLDRSSSMGQMFGSSPSQLIAALTSLDAQVNAYQPPRPTTISFVFVDFPSEDSSGCAGQPNCCAGNVSTDWPAFKQKVYACANSSSCPSSQNRPTKDALADAEAALTGAGAPASPRYILLITDGSPRGQCASPDDCDAFISEIGTLTNEGIRLSIITLPDQDPQGFDCFNYLFTPPQAVSDSMGLATAVSTFMQSAACNATLSPVPAPGTDLHVTFGQDNTPINPDRNNGWSYDGSGRLRLRGSACSQVVQFGWSTLKVSSGCGRPGF